MGDGVRRGWYVLRCRDLGSAMDGSEFWCIGASDRDRTGALIRMLEYGEYGLEYGAENGNNWRGCYSECMSLAWDRDWSFLFYCNFGPFAFCLVPCALVFASVFALVFASHHSIMPTS